LRILVSIANYGYKNAKYLMPLIREYDTMPCEADIVVLSNVPKDLGPNVEVVVGLPTRDPWSLPFGHKKIFAERLEDYDLFIYSEDDTLITWKNVQSFLRLTKVLPTSNISGFLRYEMDSTGKKRFPDFVGPYHWLPETVSKIDDFIFAEFSNVHSACYILLRDQLRRAITSGGYLVGPHQERYDLLCSAATDPYTQCGLKKVICISHISDMLVHHLPNKYVDVWGIDEDDFDRQISVMLSPEYSGIPQQELFITTKNIDNIRWDKMYYYPPDRDLLSLMSQKTKSVLSVGCGYPSTEAILVQNNHKVTAIPLDSIVGALSYSKGINIMEPNFEKAFNDLDGTLFDCIILSEVLQHLKDPFDILSRSAKLLAPDGELLISIPNFSYSKFFRDYFPYPIFKRWTYSKNLLQMVDKNQLKKWFRYIGIDNIDFHYVVESRRLKKLRPSFGVFNILFANRLLVRGRRAEYIA
jgi:2-polyprenyl-3-methyl-5-hydroxy-6-metoxy-1,4-benzoquinol methylase